MLNDPNVTAVLAAINQSLAALVDRDRHYEQERRQHVGDVQHMNEAISALTKSNEKVNDSINKLILQTKTSEQHIEILRELIISKDTENKTSNNRLAERVGALEKYNFESTGERRASEKHSKFWQDNWFKLITLFIILIPVIVGISKMLKE
jgi:hypothetical protein